MKYNVKIILEKRKNKAGDLITENVPVIAQVTFSGNRIFYFTGYRINSVNFDAEKQQATKNSTGKEGMNTVQYNTINNRIKAITAGLFTFFDGRDTATTNEVKNVLDGICKKVSGTRQPDDITFFGMFNRYRTDSDCSLLRKKTIGSVINHWLAYQQKRNINLTFESITPAILSDFEKFLKNGTPPKGINTIHKILAITRSFIISSRRELKQQGIALKNPFEDYSVPGEVYGTPIYITRQERDVLLNATMPTERLARVRDVFAFQCLIGCRVGDLIKFTKSNIQGSVLSYIPRKTKDGKPVTVNVPLHPVALEILSRYDMPDGRLLPTISDQRYNDYLKEVFEIAGITRNVTRRNPTTGESEQVRICDIASSHMARRAFVGNLFGRVDSEIIASMSGHVKGSKAFSRYYDVDQDLQQKAIELL